MEKLPRIMRLLMSCMIVWLMVSCQKDQEAIAPVLPGTQTQTLDSGNLSVNNWIYDVMSSYYLWNDQLPSAAVPDTDPKAYFNSLLYQDDRFSYITDDYAALQAEFSGVYKSMGFNPTFGLFSDSSQVFMAVNYVYPSSPAAEAGLKRGDIVVAIDGQSLTKNNYYNLYNQDAFTVTLGQYDGTAIQPTDKQLSLTARVIQTDPLLYREVKTYGAKKVGYIVYAEFISGSNDEWLSSLGTSLDEFRQAGVTDVVVDLRYNPGGEIGAANYFASALAPASVVNNNDVLVKFEYNQPLENSIFTQEGSNSNKLTDTFSANGHNLDLNQIYFLTSHHTASASELLINGLKPYMNVTMIGEPTVGKFYGSWVIPDTETPPRHNWAVMPLVLRYANATGDTGFNDGLTPDYIVNDNVLDAKAFGDETEPLLSTALSLITGGTVSRVGSFGKAKPYGDLTNPEEARKNILQINKPETGTAIVAQ